MNTLENTFGADRYDQNSIEELKEAIENYQLFGEMASDCKEITPQEWFDQIKAAFYDKITDLVEESKKEAEKYGSFEISSGVYLMTGKNVLEETEDYRSEMETDEISCGYTVEDICDSGLYIQADEYFYSADDSEIRKIIENLI